MSNVAPGAIFQRVVSRGTGLKYTSCDHCHGKTGSGHPSAPDRFFRDNLLKVYN